MSLPPTPTPNQYPNNLSNPSPLSPSVSFIHFARTGTDDEGGESDIDNFTPAELKLLQEEEAEEGFSDDDEEKVDAKGVPVVRRPNYDGLVIKGLYPNVNTMKGYKRASLLYFRFTRRRLREGKLADKTLPYWVITVKRSIQYTDYILMKEIKGTHTLRLQTRNTALNYTLAFFRWHYSMGGNEANDRTFTAAFPDVAARVIKRTVTDHFGSEAICLRLRDKRGRGQFFPCDIENAYENNNPFWALTFLVFATFSLVILCGTRDGSCRALRLLDIFKVNVDEFTGLVYVTIGFRHFKKMQPAEVRPRTFCGYLYWTPGFRIDFVYWLHRLLVLRTHGRYGLVFPTKRRDSYFGYKIDMSQSFPTPEEVKAGEYTTWEEVVNDFGASEIVKHFEANEVFPVAAEVPDFSSPLLHAKAGANAKMVRTAFAHYPEELTSTWDFHSGRGGCFVYRVWAWIMSCIKITPKEYYNAMLEASMCVGWREKFKPQWYARIESKFILKQPLTLSRSDLPLLLLAQVLRQGDGVEGLDHLLRQRWAEVQGRRRRHLPPDGLTTEAALDRAPVRSHGSFVQPQHPDRRS